MPLIDLHNTDPLVDGRQSKHALLVRDGVLKGFSESDWVFLPELTLPNGRRADLVGMDARGTLKIIEIKSSVADYAVDKKWEEYLEYCDLFYFATHGEVPIDIFPDDQGLILADGYDCEIIRPAEIIKLTAPTRKSVINRFARAAAARLQSLTNSV
ncbi:MAG: MmcB family DNA repair protein [Pseudomonadota bacterium]